MPKTFGEIVKLGDLPQEEKDNINSIISNKLDLIWPTSLFFLLKNSWKLITLP